MGTGVGIVHSPPSAQSTAQHKFRRLLGRSTARGGFSFMRTGGVPHRTREKCFGCGLAAEVRRWGEVPTPLSIFPTELLSALSPRLRLFIQRVQAQHGRVPLKSERSSTSCFGPSPFIPLALHLPPLWFARFDTPSHSCISFPATSQRPPLEVRQRIQSWSE